MNIPTTEEAGAEISFREALLPPKLRGLRQKLGRKAKQEKRYRFYSLYELVCRPDTLQAAWAAVRRNDGAPGVDEITIAAISATPEGEARFMAEIERSLRERTYRADQVKLILEPIFEADFEDCSHGFRPERSAHDALKAIHRNLKEGLTAVYDADLAGYFDSIPHEKLMACVRMRVVDGAVLGLIREWLQAPVVEATPKDGGPPTVKRNERGTPQGGVLSPLLANIYLHWFDHVFERADGPVEWARAKLTRYADDFVVQARYVGTRLQGWIEGKLEGWLGLTINREKTRVVKLTEPKASVDFLGYTFRQSLDLHGRAWSYWNLEPSRKAMAKEREALRGLINPSQSHTPLPELIERVNRHRRGWAGYFKLGYSRKAFRAMNRFVVERLTKHLHRRSQRGWRPREGVSAQTHLIHMGLELL